jgi:tetratricopeptide (TPR) repeat protein
LASLYGSLASATGNSSGLNTLGKGEEAGSLYRKQLAMYGALPQTSERLSSMAAVHANLGGLFTNAGKNKEALAEYRKALEMELEAAKSRSDAVMMRELAIAYHNLGVGYEGTHEYPQAIDALRTAQSRFQSLVTADPGNLNARYDLASNSYRSAEAQYLAKNYDEAAEGFRQTIAMYDELQAKDPKSGKFRNSQGLAWYGLSRVYLKVMAGPAAVDAAAHAARLFEMMGTSGEQLLARASMNAGQGAAISGNWKDARNWYQKSVDLWQAAKNKRSLDGYNAARPAEAKKGLEDALAHLAPAAPPGPR